MFWNTFYKLCKDNGTSPNAVAREIGSSSGAVTTWKNGKIPHAPTLQKIADYFDVSVDYLLDKEETKKISSMSFKEIFIKLCNKKGESPSAVCKKVGITPSSFSCWTDESIPRKATLMRIADYFGVTVDELLKEKEETKKSPSVSDEDIKFALFGGEGEITDEMWEAVREYAQFVKEKYGKK